MFCPKCGVEYRQGFVECSDCQIALVDEQPSSIIPDKLDFITVFESGDPALIAVAESLLKGAGIQYFVFQNELQDLIGVGRMGGLNPIVGPVRFQVEKIHAEQATVLLSKLKSLKNESG